MKRVVVFGVFDLLHPGHLYFLREAKKQGTHLTVVVTRDERVRKEKGQQPFFNESQRVVIVRAIKWVDRAVLGDKVGEHKILKRLRPNVICLGYDQAKWLSSDIDQRRVKIVHLKALNPRTYTSTKLKTHLRYARCDNPA